MVLGTHILGSGVPASFFYQELQRSSSNIKANVSFPFL